MTKQTRKKSNIIMSENSKENDKTEIEFVDYDQLLSSAGEFGLYQVLLCVATFPFYWFGVFSYFTQLFMTEVSPNHWCWVPELENLTDLERRSLAIPLDKNSRYGYSRCRQFTANWSELLITGEKPDHSWNTQVCQNGWEFNKSEIPYPTISSEMGWVCERDSYPATAQSIFFVGSVVGGFFIGWIADRFGRLPATVSSNMIGCVAGIASMFAQNFAQFTIYRFFMGMSYDNCMVMAYLIVLEYVAPKYRTMAANLPFAIFFSLGLVTLPWISLACGHWKVLALATSLPMALSLLAPFIMPESPRWLLSKGRVDETVNKILTIGRINKKEISSKLIEKFKQSNSNKIEENGSILELLKRPLLRRMFICSCLEYTCCMIVFDSLVRSISQLEYNFFLSFTIISLTELPSVLLVSFILDLTGRKWLILIVLTISSIFSVLTAFVGSGLPSVLCAVVARFAVNMSLNAAMQWAAEMLPTPVRGNGVAIAHNCSHVGTIISPFIVYLETYVEWLPLVVVACVSAFGVVVSLGMPETAGKEMPKTFEEAEELIRSDNFLRFPCMQKAKCQHSVGHKNDTFQMD